MHIGELDFTGRRVLVTGAASGIGAAMSRAFASAGATLLLADRDVDGLDRIAGETGASERLVFDQADLASVTGLAANAGKIDVLMNNAGIVHVAPLLETDPETIDRVLRTDLTGPVVLARLIAGAMVEAGGGVIVNTASQLAFDGAPLRSIYATAKAGLVHFTRTAALELAPLGVRMTALAPGRTLTPLNAPDLATPEAKAEGLKRIPWGRFGNVEEIARLALILASPLADYVVGETLVADGGFVLT